MDPKPHPRPGPILVDELSAGGPRHSAPSRCRINHVRTSIRWSRRDLTDNRDNLQASRCDSARSCEQTAAGQDAAGKEQSQQSGELLPVRSDHVRSVVCRPSIRAGIVAQWRRQGFRLSRRQTPAQQQGIPHAVRLGSIVRVGKLGWPWRPRTWPTCGTGSRTGRPWSGSRPRPPRRRPGGTPRRLLMPLGGARRTTTRTWNAIPTSRSWPHCCATGWRRRGPRSWPDVRPNTDRCRRATRPTCGGSGRLPPPSWRRRRDRCTPMPICWPRAPRPPVPRRRSPGSSARPTMTCSSPPCRPCTRRRSGCHGCAPRLSAACARRRPCAGRCWPWTDPRQ